MQNHASHPSDVCVHNAAPVRFLLLWLPWEISLWFTSLPLNLRRETQRAGYLIFMHFVYVNGICISYDWTEFIYAITVSDSSCKIILFSRNLFNSFKIEMEYLRVPKNKCTWICEFISVCESMSWVTRNPSWRIQSCFKCWLVFNSRQGLQFTQGENLAFESFFPYLIVLLDFLPLIWCVVTFRWEWGILTPLSMLCLTSS